MPQTPVSRITSRRPAVPIFHPSRPPPPARCAYFPPLAPPRTSLEPRRGQEDSWDHAALGPSARGGAMIRRSGLVAVGSLLSFAVFACDQPVAPRPVLQADATSGPALTFSASRAD